jgi:hypothetical protein
VQVQQDAPTSLIMWTWQDAQVEQPHLLDEGLRDMARHGFSGALAMLRGCRYPISDPLILRAAGIAARIAHDLGLTFWFALDPRLDQGRLIALDGGAARYLLTGREPSGALPCEAAVDAAGRYCLRLEYGQPRGQHMLSQVAITFEPEGVERAFAYRKAPDGTLLTATLRDITDQTRLFIQRGQGYLEIFGTLEEMKGDGWHVLALPRCRSTYPELGSPAVREAMVDLYRAYHTAGVALDGVFWDEIGYVSGYGSDRCRLPSGPAIQDAFAKRHGADLAGLLPYLLLNDDAGCAGRVRRDYYAAVQGAVLGAQACCSAEARRLWGPDVESGIHQTWHQNANDLPHGSGDWWRGSAALSGGYTDVGDAEQWDDEEHATETLAMAVTAVSLARFHARPRAFCNLWGVDYGEPGSRAPGTILDWWADLLSAFGIVWLAHTYGPNGYIDCFTNWGPGYPNHPTWDRLTGVNRRIARIHEITGGGLPDANVAVVYPLDTLAEIGSACANMVARDAQRVVAGLTRQQVAVDVISPALFAGGEARGGRLVLHTPRGCQRYAAVVYPGSNEVQPDEPPRFQELRAASVPCFVINPQQAGAANGALYETVRELPRLVEAPAGSLVNLFHRADGDLALTVVPAEFGRPVEGPIRYGDVCLDISALSGLAAVRFGPDGRERDRLVYDGNIELRKDVL